jgi:hypothetical protein
MLISFLQLLGSIVWLLAFFAWMLVAYHQIMFIAEWSEDHAQSLPRTTRGLASTTAILSTSLSDRCRYRRRRLLTMVAVFIVLCVLGTGVSLLIHSPYVAREG